MLKCYLQHVAFLISLRTCSPTCCLAKLQNSEETTKQNGTFQLRIARIGRIGLGFFNNGLNGLNGLYRYFLTTNYTNCTNFLRGFPQRIERMGRIRTADCSFIGVCEGRFSLSFCQICCTAMSHTAQGVLCFIMMQQLLIHDAAIAAS